MGCIQSLLKLIYWLCKLDSFKVYLTSIQKGFSVNKNLHYLNITKVFKYKSNIKTSLDGSKPIIIVLNCGVLYLKPRKVHFVFFYFGNPGGFGFPSWLGVIGQPVPQCNLGRNLFLCSCHFPEPLQSSHRDFFLPFNDFRSLLKILITESFWPFNIKTISSDYSLLERVDWLFEGICYMLLNYIEILWIMIHSVDQRQ